MKKLLTFAALAAVGASATVTAYAQESWSSPVGVSLKVGIFDPTESDTRNNTGNSWLGAGIDFKINGLKFNKLPPGYFSVSLDYEGRGSYRSAPLLINYTSGKTFYWSAGAGVSFVRFPQDDGTINDKVRFEYSGALGFNFTNGQIPLFLEARYFGNEQPRVAGVAFYVGARF